MENVYVFKVASKYNTNFWRRIEIKGSQTLDSFDSIIRDAFNHDTFDHLSEFYKKKGKHLEGLGTINPFGQGEGSNVKINEIEITSGEEMEYIYDFGDSIEHVIKLEKIIELEKSIKYPRIVAQNKPQYKYCELCRKMGKETIATWVCFECSDDKGGAVYICEDCLDKEHENHNAEEILY